MTLTSCGGLERQLQESAAAQGRLDAGIEIPKQPEDCEKTEEHAALGEGSEARAILRRERAALTRQNTRGLRCWQFNEDIRVRFSGPK